MENDGDKKEELEEGLVGKEPDSEDEGAEETDDSTILVDTVREDLEATLRELPQLFERWMKYYLSALSVKGNDQKDVNQFSEGILEASRDIGNFICDIHSIILYSSMILSLFKCLNFIRFNISSISPSRYANLASVNFPLPLIT